MTFFSTQPLYLQVRESLAGRIASGEWKSNTALPNENELARDLGVSPGTMRKALDLLEADGLVNRRQGRGTFVCDPASTTAVGKFNHIHSKWGEPILGVIASVDLQERLAIPHERERLKLADFSPVYHLTRVRAHEGKPYMVEEVTIPSELLPGVSRHDLTSRWLGEIAASCGVLLGHAVEKVKASGASARSADILGISKGEPILLLERVISTREGRPIEWRLAECSTTALHVKITTS